ncbi:unnamed protein product, partial [Pylaiella littoralis]
REHVRLSACAYAHGCSMCVVVVVSWDLNYRSAWTSPPRKINKYMRLLKLFFMQDNNSTVCTASRTRQNKQTNNILGASPATRYRQNLKYDSQCFGISIVMKNKKKITESNADKTHFVFHVCMHLRVRRSPRTKK